ncbi:endonuclease/exonuclease/phosphatase family metal-dependent hydrolase [Flavobacterium sp. 7E]|uniref:endonuclease/exonuclease/phosphatase family protein n=1 Tax=Flavobacterium sp. 7E TaxID=2735898 RepID=UPI001570C3AC|nr:endonuclease/exonuclease/phosphatase family protein [Flavobacterium sp. 7E]NRS89131.1 endonuclease/exonuclease/phosphatase family metal-dependent hydrolase [Flavobacterium sp. 7E]
MKQYFSLLFFFFYVILCAQTKLISWNIENIGRSKSVVEIEFIAKTVRDYDIIAIQEVVAGYGGSQAIARLADELNRKGSKWNYVISEPTTSSAYKTERYAFLWKTAKVKKIGNAWLEQKYHLQIDREPFYCTFESEGKQFTVVNFHAITKNKQPETEIKYFKFLPEEYPNLNLIFAGDFNCPQSHSVFNPLKKSGYLPSLVNQKTSLKRACKKGKCLASEYDNIFYNTYKINKKNSGSIHFYKTFRSLLEARKISDHIPIWLEFNVR